MSYNGIGLKTARGTGTNGYVQRNLASAKRQENRGHFARREQLAGTHEKNKERNKKQASLGKDPEISEHEQKRRIEVKCMDLRETLEDEDVDDETIEEKVRELRERLLKQMIPTRHAAEIKEEETQKMKKAMREREPYQLRKLPKRQRSRSPPTKDEADSFIKDFKYEAMY